MPQLRPQFLPIRETDQGQVYLPGLAGGPEAANPGLFPPGTYPIPASGEYTGTLFPLADPIPPQPMPLPPEIASVAMPGGMMEYGIPPMELPAPPPLEFPDFPLPAGADVPGLQSLAEPLPTSLASTLPALPPMSVPFPDVDLPPVGQGQGTDLEFPAGPQQGLPPDILLPEPPRPTRPFTALADPLPTSTSDTLPALPPMAVPFPQVSLPQAHPQGVIALPDAPLPQLSDRPLAAPLPTSAEAVQPLFPPMQTPLPDVPLPVPTTTPFQAVQVGSPTPSPFPELRACTPTALPAPVVADPLSGAVQPGMAALLEALDTTDKQRTALERFTENRNRLRAGEPQANLGKIVWEQQWGNE